MCCLSMHAVEIPKQVKTTVNTIAYTLTVNLYLTNDDLQVNSFL